MIEPRKHKVSETIQLWATDQMDTVTAAKTIAQEVDFAGYHSQHILIQDKGELCNLSALLRELARKAED